ncbi:ABC transporter permease [Pseudomonadota bacterium]
MVMAVLKALDKKVLRDLGSMWAQALAIAMVIGAGVAMFVMSEGMMRSLVETRAAYYERYAFADAFSGLKRAPNAVQRRIAQVPGVRFAETRIKKHVTLDMPGVAEPVRGEILSYPVGDEPRLNRLRLMAGRWLAPGHADETLVSEAFAEAHGLSPGDGVTAIVNGRKRTLSIAGLVLSPEYIYALEPGGMMPDNKRFGIFWMSRPGLEAAFDMTGAFNDVIVALDPGANRTAAMAALDRVLDPYGGIGAYARDRQTSHWYLSGEMDQLRNMAQIVPPIFLAIAAFLLNVVITRWIETEREEIGLLKAFGYSTVHVATHYIKLIMAITSVGVLIGFAGGVWMGRGLAVLYQEFFRFPFLHFNITPSVFAIAGGLSILVALLGTWRSVRRAALLPPAEAMVPPPPTVYTRTWLEGWINRLAGPSRMIVRHLVRWPLRSVLTIIGNAAAVGVLIGSMFFMDAMETLIDINFNRAERQDATVSFVEAKEPRALDAVRAMPGVLSAEPFRAVSAKLRFGGAERQEGLTGQVADASLSRILDADYEPVAIPEHGLVLSQKLSEILGAGVGDTVMAQVTEGRRPVLELSVVQVSETMLGSPAFMNFVDLNAVMGEPGRISGVYVRLDSARADEFYSAVKNTPGIAGVALKRTTLKAFRDTMAENILIMTMFNVIFAGVIAVGVVYNAARISLSERSRELASLRVLGFTLGEAAYILLGELWALTLLALPVGCAMGYGLAWLWTLQLDTDLYRIPLTVGPQTYGLSVLVVVVAAAGSSLVTFRQIAKLDLVQALKIKE